MPDILPHDTLVRAVEANSQTPVLKNSPPKGRLHYVDSLRALAALVVIVNHACQQIWWFETPTGWMRTHYLWFCQGRYAVVAFIVLSGFCLMLPVTRSGSLRGGTWAFYRGRALRILPAYWAAMLVALLLIATLIGQKHNVMFDYSIPVTWRGILSHFFLINNLIPNFGSQWQDTSAGNTEISSVFRTIALEWQIYFWFPLFVWMWQKIGMYRTLEIGAIAVVVLQQLFLHRAWFGLQLDGINIFFYFYFLLGMLAATLAFGEKTARIVKREWINFLAVGMIIGFPLLYAASPRIFSALLNRGYGHYDVMAMYTAVMMAAILISGALRGFKWLSWKPLADVGNYSYSVYLLHLPLLALLTNYVILPLRGHIARNLEFALLLLTGIPLILICSKLFSSVFEDKRVLTRCWTTCLAFFKLRANAPPASEA